MPCAHKRRSARCAEAAARPCSCSCHGTRGSYQQAHQSQDPIVVVLKPPTTSPPALRLSVSVRLAPPHEPVSTLLSGDVTTQITVPARSTVIPARYGVAFATLTSTASEGSRTSTRCTSLPAPTSCAGPPDSPAPR